MTSFLNRSAVRALVLCVIGMLCLCLIVCGISGCGSQQEASAESDTRPLEPEQQAEQVAVQSVTPQAEPQLPDDSSFTCTFLDVGQGDCAILACDGHYAMIDGGPSEASQIVYSYLKSSGISSMDYMFATHADSDHVGGLAAALQLVAPQRAFCSVTSADKKAFSSYVKYLDQRDIALEVPQVGDSFELGSAKIQVIAPRRADASGNDDSLVLRVTYGDTSFLFAGDASEEEEQELLSSGYALDSDVLKVAHHGSSHSSTAAFLRRVSPSIAVICVGSGNSYGHPTVDALKRLTDAGAAVYRTDLQGDIVITSDGKNVSVTTEKQASTSTATAPSETETHPAAEYYIGNKNSKKFHLPTCKNLPAERNQVILSTREEAIEGGFSPCGNCKP